MMFAATDVSSLSTQLSRWEVAEYISAFFVAVACAGEGIADFTKWFTGGVKERKERLAKASTLLLIASLAIELVCLVKTNSLSGQLIGSLADKAEAADREARTALQNSSTAETEASTAKTDASSALTIASGARQEAATFKEEIKAAKKAAADANQKLADRKLTVAQQKTITDKLTQFAGQQYTVTAYWDSKESLNLANNIHFSLKAANWTYDDEGSKSMMLGGMIGIFVACHPEADENTKRATEALVSALQAEGLDVITRTPPTKNNPKNNKIWITVGSKR
jgi:hypothetical protein